MGDGSRVGWGWGTLLGWISLPWLVLAAAVLAVWPRTRTSIRERLGLSVPPVVPGSTWIHAASVGELRAASALWTIVPGPVLQTVATDTAREVGVRLASTHPGVTVGVLPIEHPFALAPLWAEARPVRLILVESATPVGLVFLARTQGVEVWRVSARRGAGSRRWGRWWNRVAPVDRVWARGEASLRDLLEVLPGPVEPGPDLKALAPAVPVPWTWARPFVVGLSTWEEDEAALFAARPDGLAVLIAPRDPTRAAAIEAEARRQSCRVLRRSAWSGGPVSADVFVLDTLGELAGAVDGARAALVGGSFGRGAHAADDALRAGVPVVAGPVGGVNAEGWADRGVARVDDVEGLRRWLAAPPAAVVPRRPAVPEAWRVPPPAPAPERSPRPWLAPWGRVVHHVGGAVLAHRDRAAIRVEVPVLSVGSRNARGPGRTSLGREIARQFAAAGRTVGVVVRGVGRRRRDLGRETDADPFAALGDEGNLFARDGHRVAASPDRVRAARALIAAGADVIVVDDGAQARRLARDLDLLVVDARAPWARGPLPEGEARPVSAGEALAVWTHASDRFPAPDGAITVQRRPGPWWYGDRPSAAPPQGALVVSGLGRPADAWGDAGDLAGPFVRLRPHAPVSDPEARRLVERAGALGLVTTAKDRVRLPRWLQETVYWRDLEVELVGFDPVRWLEARRRDG